MMKTRNFAMAMVKDFIDNEVCYYIEDDVLYRMGSCFFESQEDIEDEIEYLTEEDILCNNIAPSEYFDFDVWVKMLKDYFKEYPLEFDKIKNIYADKCRQVAKTE